MTPQSAVAAGLSLRTPRPVFRLGGWSEKLSWKVSLGRRHHLGLAAGTLRREEAGFLFSGKDPEFTVEHSNGGWKGPEPKPSSPRPWLLDLTLLTFGAGPFLAVGGCAGHHRLLTNTSGFYPLESSGQPLHVGTTQNISRHRQMSPGGTQSPPVQNHWSTWRYRGPQGLRPDPGAIATGNSIPLNPVSKDFSTFARQSENRWPSGMNPWLPVPTRASTCC